MMTGALKMNADFLTANKQGKLSEALAAPRIKEADVVSAAKEYAASLSLPDLPPELYHPSELFGENTKLVVYSLSKDVWRIIFLIRR